MRIVQFNNGITCEIPNYAIFTGDKNLVRFNYSSGSISARVQIGNDIQQYESRLSDITFDIGDLLKRNRINNDQISVTISCSLSGSTFETRSFDCRVMLGKTLPHRFHGSQNIITYVDAFEDLQEVEMYASVAGVWSDNDTDPASIEVENPCIEYIDLTSMVFPGGEIVLNFNGSANAYFGYAWDPYAFRNNKYRFVKKCIPENGIKIYYYNTDGCLRVCVGKITGVNTSQNITNYIDVGVVKNEPNFVVDGNETEFTVVFDDVQSNEYLEDIVFSQRIYYIDANNEEREMCLSSSGMKTTNETKELTLNFKVLC